MSVSDEWPKQAVTQTLDERGESKSVEAKDIGAIQRACQEADEYSYECPWRV